MARYLLRRVIFLVVVIWTAATVNFFLPRTTGQNPIRERIMDQISLGSSYHAGIEDLVAQYDKKFGLDKPLWRQYLTYLGDLARFDLGQSIARYPNYVVDIIAGALPWTIGLLATSTLFSVIVGTLFGAVVAWPRAPRWIRSLGPPIFTLSAIPYYLLGLVLLFIFAFRFRWLPGSGGHDIGSIPSRSWDFALEVLEHSLLPALSIVLSSIGFWAMGMRGMVVTVEGEDYMTLGEAKGLKDLRLFFSYGIRNALLPQVTSFALAMAFVLSGAVLVEVVFSYPGIGYMLFKAVQGVDYPLIQGIVMTIILALAMATLILDLTLPVLDPRIRRE
jgi:peptide/nickel transport system permease protein